MATSARASSDAHVLGLLYSTRQPRIPWESGWCIFNNAHNFEYFEYAMQLRAALHLEATPIFLEANCTKIQPFLGWRLAWTTHYNKIIMGANSRICKVVSGEFCRGTGLFSNFLKVTRLFQISSGSVPKDWILFQLKSFFCNVTWQFARTFVFH